MRPAVVRTSASQMATAWFGVCRLSANVQRPVSEALAQFLAGVTIVTSAALRFAIILETRPDSTLPSHAAHHMGAARSIGGFAI